MAATMPVFHLEAEVVTLTRPTAVHAVRSQGPAFATCGEVRVCCHTSIGAIVAAADGSGGRSKKTAASPQLRKCGFTRGAKLQLQLLRPCSTSDDGAPLAASSAEDQAQVRRRFTLKFQPSLVVLESTLSGRKIRTPRRIGWTGFTQSG